MPGAAAQGADAVRQRLSQRVVIGVVLSVAWIAMMVAVWRNETGRSGRSLREFGISQHVMLSTWIAYDQWMTIEHNGKRIGATRTTVRQSSPRVGEAESGTMPLPDFIMRTRARLTASLMNMNIPLDLQAQVRMNEAFEVEIFQAAADLGGQRLRLDAFVEGRTLYYRLRTGVAALGDDPSTAATTFAGGILGGLLPDRDVAGSSPIDGPIVLEQMMAPVLGMVSRGEQLKPGMTWSTRVSNPLHGSLNQTLHVEVIGRDELTINGEQRSAWKLLERTGNFGTTVWYDDRGQPLRREMNNGFVMQATSSQSVLEVDSGFRSDLVRMDTIDRQAILDRIDPELRDVPLSDLLPPLPRL